MAWFEDQLLHPPVQQFGNIKFVLRGAGHLVNPAKLLGLLTGFAEYAENLPLKAKFVDAPRESIGSVQHLVRPRRDADSPRRPGRHGAGSLGGLVADRRASVRLNRHVDRKLALKLAVTVEHLDATIPAVGNIDVAFSIRSDAVGHTKLSRLVPGFAPRLHPVPVLVHLGNARIHVAIADV